MSDAEPNWNLLPHAPREFFGLEDGYDLKDLRRSYNKLIRQFKPESAPTEFQRIRAAYERLNEALRYGDQDAKTTPISQFDWSSLLQPPPTSTELPAEPPTEATSGKSGERDDQPLSTRAPHPTSAQGSAQPVPARKSLSERLASEPLPDIFEEIRSREEKTPQDYFVLATLSDFVQEEPLSFARCLLEGLAEYPDEPGLFRLLQEHLATATNPEQAVALAELTAQHVQTDSYYRLTERLWVRLLREVEFEVFRQALAECESRILDHESDYQRVFYLRLLPAALWKADDGWLAAKFDQAEQLYSHLPGWASREFDFLDHLRAYRNRSPEFVRQGATHRRIHQAIIDFCSLEEADADRSFLEIQHILAGNIEALMQDFMIPSPDFTYVFVVWDWIADDIAQRVSRADNALSPERLQLRIQGLAFSLVETGEETPYVIHSYLFNAALLLWVLGSVALLGYGGYLCFTDLFFHVDIWASLKHGAAIFGLLIVGLAAMLLLSLVEERIVLHYYRQIWRRMILKFFETGTYTTTEIANELKRLDGKTIDDKSLNSTGKIGDLLRTDPAAEFYATAMRLLTN